VARFDLDAAILFSDILTVPDAMGLGLYFVDGEGPKFEHPIRSVADRPLSCAGTSAARPMNSATCRVRG